MSSQLLQSFTSTNTYWPFTITKRTSRYWPWLTASEPASIVNRYYVYRPLHQHGKKSAATCCNRVTLGIQTSGCQGKNPRPQHPQDLRLCRCGLFDGQLIVNWWWLMVMADDSQWCSGLPANLCHCLDHRSLIDSCTTHLLSSTTAGYPRMNQSTNQFQIVCYLYTRFFVGWLYCCYILSLFFLFHEPWPSVGVLAPAFHCRLEQRKARRSQGWRIEGPVEARHSGASCGAKNGTTIPSYTNQRVPWVYHVWTIPCSKPMGVTSDEVDKQRTYQSVDWSWSQQASF